MADRITVADVKHVFQLFLKEYNLPAAKNALDRGGYALDRYQGYWKIVQIGEHGGEHEPFGSTRYSTREFFEALHFAIRLGNHLRYGR